MIDKLLAQRAKHEPISDKRAVLGGIEKEIVRVSKAARNGALAVEDLRGGTFTITSGGAF